MILIETEVGVIDALPVVGRWHIGLFFRLWRSDGR